VSLGRPRSEYGGKCGGRVEEDTIVVSPKWSRRDGSDVRLFVDHGRRFSARPRLQGFVLVATGLRAGHSYLAGRDAGCN
jgi:hypothetical protein